MKGSWAHGAGRGALAVAIALVLAGNGCASESDSSLVVEGSWERMELWEQRESFDFDQVAAGNSTDTVAWLNRSDDDADRLSYWEIRDGGDATAVELPGPDGPLLIPVAVAVDADGWGAVAVTRDQAQGANTGLLAWHGTSGLDTTADIEAAQPLTPPGDVAAPPESVSVGRSADVLVVAALYDGEPVLWSREGDDDAWLSDVDGIDLGFGPRADLTSLRVVGDGERLVLAAVAGNGTTHLWSSEDGGDWAPVESDDLPESAGAVGLLAPLEPGGVAVGWLSDEESAPWNATSATIQRLTGDDLADEGEIEALPDDEVQRLHLTSATLSPDDRLVVVGGALRPDSDRTPMAWVAAGDSGADGWEPTTQAELTGHLDHEFRAIVSTDDDRMVAVASALSHPDVESWQWRPED
jgi:WD40 repeat protein